MLNVIMLSVVLLNVVLLNVVMASVVALPKIPTFWANFYFFKVFPDWVANPGCFSLFSFILSHFTGELQPLLKLLFT
jgi:hypothetical protein